MSQVPGFVGGLSNKKAESYYYLFFNFVGLVYWKPCIDYLLYNTDNCGAEPDFNTFSSHKPDNNNYNFYYNIGNNQKQSDICKIEQKNIQFFKLDP